MLRAEQALDKARANGRDGFAAYQPSASRETARLRHMAIADEVVQALRDNRVMLAFQPIVAGRVRARPRITNACCAWPMPTARS